VLDRHRRSWWFSDVRWRRCALKVYLYATPHRTAVDPHYRSISIRWSLIGHQYFFEHKRAVIAKHCVITTPFLAFPTLNIASFVHVFY
jgi:hypothetical protein